MHERHQKVYLGFFCEDGSFWLMARAPHVGRMSGTIIASEACRLCTEAGFAFHCRIYCHSHVHCLVGNPVADVGGSRVLGTSRRIVENSGSHKYPKLTITLRHHGSSHLAVRTSCVFVWYGMHECSSSLIWAERGNKKIVELFRIHAARSVGQCGV